MIVNAAIMPIMLFLEFCLFCPVGYIHTAIEKWTKKMELDANKQKVSTKMKIIARYVHLYICMLNKMTHTQIVINTIFPEMHDFTMPIRMSLTD